MTEIVRGGQVGAADHIESTQGVFRQQLAALADAMRQVVGNAAIVPGAGGQADPLSAPFTLYVNPYTGSDKFVGGSYNTFEGGETDEEIIASKLKRIEMQRLECGFTPQRPFKTINRAVIEAAIITSKSWYTYTDPRAHVDCVSIVLSPGVHTLHNDPGATNPSLVSWGDAKDPTIAELIAFNPKTVGGVILPRGCSLCGPDLRKTTIRPTWVPAVADEKADYSNRRAMLKITGTGYFFGFTVMDKVGHQASHHLLDSFHFASKDELDEFYAKCFSAVGGGANLGAALTVTRPTEYQIVGPIEAGTSPSPSWDTTASASPYIFNCSIRSDYGIGGAFMDGSKVSGLKSMVTAQFTGVSLQKDMSCWQRYVDGEWVPTTYEQYIETEPNNIRMNPVRMSRHISAINDAFIQEVSVFAIGQGIHHFTDRGGEITVTNSNSSFGGCAALSTGYKTAAFPQDKNWTLNRIKVPLNPDEKTGNVRRIFLGTISEISSTKITLVNPLAVNDTSSSVPANLLKDGYSFAAGTKIWVENPSGAHWRTDLASSAWSASNPGEIRISKALLQADTNEPVGVNPETDQSLAIGKQVYIRRLVDTRTPSERRVLLQLNNTATARWPERSFIVQTDPARAGGGIRAEFEAGGNQVFAVTGTGVGQSPAVAGVAKTAEVTIRRCSTSVSYAKGAYYRAGTTVKFRGKHYQSLKDQLTESATPNPLTWGENFVHMPSAYSPEDVGRNEAPFLVFDTDTDSADNTETCGINFTTVWTVAGSVRDQYRSGTDYQGVHGFLVAMGLTSDQAHQVLLPRGADLRLLNPASDADFPVAPSGGAADGRGNWALEFRRPSVLRLYGHAWEWAGYLNYSKSIPAAQKDLSPQNKFTYYYTNDRGGRVVPQGSNEDGFNVSPRGLEDVETGATLTVDLIGSSTLDDFQSTDFPNGLTASDITVNNLTINTSVTFPEVSAARTTTLGPVRLADAAKLRSAGMITGANDTQRNSSINAEPDVVTLKGLNYWARNAGVMTRRTGVAVLYVVPDNAVSSGTYSFDGTSATLTSDPNRSGANLMDTPPLTRNTAVRFSRAVEYANSIYSELETVNYYLANGPYWTSVTFNHIANVVGAARRFPVGNVVADFTKANTKPTTDVKAIHDANGPFLAPCFATPITSAVSTTSPRVSFAARPTSLRFNLTGSVTGLCWLSATQTLNDTTNFPSSIYSTDLQPYRVPGISVQTFLDLFLDAVVPAGFNVDKFWSASNIFAKGPMLTVRDCIFGAKASGRGTIGYGDRGPTIRAENDLSVVAQGIYFLGNTAVTAFPLATAKGVKVSATETYGCKNTQEFIGSRVASGRSVRLTVGFPFRYSANTVGDSSDRNFDVNCLHVLDDNGYYGLLANRSATDGTRGASMEFIIGEMNAGSLVYTGGYSSYQINFTNPSKHHGWAGAFGNNGTSSEGPTGFSTALGPLSFYRFDSYHNSVWQTATTATTITSNVTLTPAPGKDEFSYDNSGNNPMNVKTRAFYRGIDINSAQLVGGSLQSDRFFG